jgi:hypothetical protein
VEMHHYNHHLKSQSACFRKYMNGQATFETARDIIRAELLSLKVLHNLPIEPEAQVFQLQHQQILHLRILWPSQVMNVLIVALGNTHQKQTSCTPHKCLIEPCKNDPKPHSHCKHVLQWPCSPFSKCNQTEFFKLAASVI